MKKQKYNSLDVCKLVMAIFVIAIHTLPLQNCHIEIVNKIYSELVALAVPFFFVASGFLLGKKIEEPFESKANDGPIKKYLIKIVKLYLIWNIIYLPMTIYHFFTSAYSIKTAFLLFIQGLFFLGEQYNSWHLWYLLSTIYGVIAIVILRKLNKSLNSIVVIGCFVFLTYLGISWFINFKGNLPDILKSLQGIIDFCFSLIGKGRPIKGFFYIPIGMLLAKKDLSKYFCSIIFAVGLIFNFYFEDSSIRELVVAFSTIGFFELILLFKFKDSFIFPILRNVSTIVYFIHMYVWTIYYMLMYGQKTYGFDCFLATTIISIVCALIYITLKKTKGKINLSSDLL